MIIGVPRLKHGSEHRVGLTPFGVALLAKHGHTVVVERDAGLEAHFTDRDYETAGAQIVYSAEEVYQRSDMICRVSIIALHELGHIKRGSIICGFLHLAIAPRELVARLMEIGTTLIGYEIIRDAHGELPVLIPMSEIAGQMSLHIAAHYLHNTCKGRGVLIGNVTGVPPPTVVILGAGVVGRSAVRTALAAGSHVIIVDADITKLRALNREFPGQLVTVVAGVERLEKYIAIADAVIGAVLVPGGRAPFVVTEEMVKAMKPGSVIVDISIDQGGCVETSRPTTLENPVFVKHDVVHYCVPNMTSDIARTASRALATAALPYIVTLADKGVETALREDPGLAAGAYLYKGKMVHRLAGETLGIPVASLEQLL